MLKRVETEQDLAYYHFIWMTAWREKGYEFEFSPVVLERWLVLTPEGQPVGTAEYKPFLPGSSAFETVADIGRMPELAEKRRLVAEIDKFALLPEHRGRHYVDDLAASVVLTARKHGIRWFVSLLEPKFCRAIRFLFHPPMTVLGPRTFYKGDDVIPVVIDVKDVLADPEAFNVKLPPVPEAVGGAC
ncbi:MAG: hypothetical protein A9Z00_06805 [Thermobacillus sp. ZCTH02-B1]|uniref:GNAT family N-acetyltransferase n=1 Tax=Thermobacillus sp. ZCTH02-B1 TaxID=1858795 RepID=UPI000B554E61|nr:GNAT family N-acetyltransferase [Thermobacillus sp. ZCTH02-B1]OUM96049.1 MAG: hypothetical protein A9Z00_06805 [Thermobacillus sp. ZCTH02-B1]